MPAALRPDWTGQTVICIASGPSLTLADCEAARATGHPVVVTNTTFRIAPWADVLFGFDSNWWRQHLEEVRATFRGRLMSVSQVAGNLGIETTYGATWFRQVGNSGACAISLAICSGAKRVILIGFDCCRGSDGKNHWHGDHPKGMSNCLSMARWPAQFARVAAEAKREGVVVLNASRSTTLTCFERVRLEECLA